MFIHYKEKELWLGTWLTVSAAIIEHPGLNISDIAESLFSLGLLKSNDMHSLN